MSWHGQRRVSKLQAYPIRVIYRECKRITLNPIPLFWFLHYGSKVEGFLGAGMVKFILFRFGFGDLGIQKMYSKP